MLSLIVLSFPKSIKHMSRNATMTPSITAMLGLILKAAGMATTASNRFSFHIWCLMITHGTESILNLEWDVPCCCVYAIFKVNEYDGCPGVCGPNCNYETEDW